MVKCYISGEVAEDVDPYDLMEPVNILAALPKDFFDKIVCLYYMCSLIL